MTTVERRLALASDAVSGGKPIVVIQVLPFSKCPLAGAAGSPFCFHSARELAGFFIGECLANDRRGAGGSKCLPRGRPLSPYGPWPRARQIAFAENLSCHQMAAADVDEFHAVRPLPDLPHRARDLAGQPCARLTLAARIGHRHCGEEPPGVWVLRIAE